MKHNQRQERDNQLGGGGGHFLCRFETRLGAPKSAFLSLSFRFQFPAAAFFRRFLFRFSAATHHQPPNKPVLISRLFNRFLNRLEFCWPLTRWVSATAWPSTRHFNHLQPDVVADTVVASASTLACKQVCQQPRVSGLLWAYDASAVDKPIYIIRNRLLSGIQAVAISRRFA